ncbi:MAG: CoB--CoM heterodisulfide reductase iron-sulfur subunit B family protein [Syntrophales bacterium]|nr:CoB--CoM heterodisulfide reductase iron-sulfur subunit B family protein [Syntrophales bacterium]
MVISYYPGCSLHGTAKEYEQSVKSVSAALGIGLQEVEDWSCCGATSAHSTNFDLSIALPARNLVLVESAAVKEVMVPCAACFNRFKSAQYYLSKSDTLKRRTEEAIGRPYRGEAVVRHPLEIFYKDVGLDALAGKVTKKLVGLKPVSYYGCLLLRPPKVCQFDDPENPYMMDEILQVLGADVKKWSYKTDCCGGSLTISRVDVVGRLVNKLMTMAREAGANCIVTACPVCMANLDTRSGETVRLPVFYFTELMALAFGLSGPVNWFRMHNIDPEPLLGGLGIV